MATPSEYARSPWEDRFNVPTVAALRKELSADAGRLFDRSVRMVGELQGVKQGFGWYGYGWRWTIEFRFGRVDAPVAVIIPAPDDLQLAIPFEPDLLKDIPVKDLKRTIRDGLELAQEPFDTRWGVWSINAATLLDDLAEILDRKMTHLRAAVA